MTIHSAETVPPQAGLPPAIPPLANKIAAAESPTDPSMVGELAELAADEIEAVEEVVEQALDQATPTDASPGASVDAADAPAADQSNVAGSSDLLALRTSLLKRIADSTALPRGIRGRLVSVLQETPLIQQGGQLLAPVDTLLGVIERWSPSALRFEPGSLVRPEHPEGDSFFTGDPHSVSDEQAERIARRQLQRSGYLPAGS